MVIGPMEAGKSTLLVQLARALCGTGRSVGIVDCDVGQSEIGPPTTIGLGRASAELARLADAELVALHFVGATSPARDLKRVVLGARRMLDRAAAFERVLVDTSGLVSGDLGRALKQAKIDALDPDVIVALEWSAECEAILRPYADRPRPAILRLPALERPRRRSAEDRRRHRERALARYLARARRQVLDLRRVAMLRPTLFAGAPLPDAQRGLIEAAAGCAVPWAEARDRGVTIVAERRLAPAESRAVTASAGGPVEIHALDDLVHVAAGLEDGRGDTLGIGVVRAIDVRARTLEVSTPVEGGAITAVTLGWERIEDAGGAGRAGPARGSSPRG